MSMRRIAYFLLMATLFTIPFEDIYKLPGIGTMSRVFGFLTFAAWTLAAFADGKMRRPDAFHTFAFWFVFWVGLSLFWSLDSNTTLDRIETSLQLLALSLVVWDLCESSRAVRTAIQALVLGLWLASISVFVNFAQGVEAYYGRFSASGADPNYMSMMLALGMPLAWYLSLHSEQRQVRLMNVLYVPVAGLAMGLTGSRGGFLAGFVAIGYILSTIRRLQPAGFVALLIAVGAAVAAISLVVPDTTIERIVSVGDEISEGDLNGRAGIWLEAWDAFVERPVVGIGAGASRAVLPTGKVPHSVAITIGLELGIVGLALFTAMVAASLRFARWLTPRYRGMWLSVIAIWAIGSLSLSLETRKLTWVLFSLLLGATVAARQAAGSSAGEREGPATIRPASTPEERTTLPGDVFGRPSARHSD